jgi:hypothetical protein
LACRIRIEDWSRTKFEPLLIVRRVLREQFVILHRRLLAIVRDDEVCRRLMTTSSTMQMLVSLTDTSNPAKWSMLRFSF